MTSITHRFGGELRTPAPARRQNLAVRPAGRRSGHVSPLGRDRL